MITHTDFGITEEEFKEKVLRYSNRHSIAIKAGGESLTDELTGALLSLYEKEIIPIVIHSAGKQIDDALETAGIQTEKIEGKRVTTKEALEVIVNAVSKTNTDFTKMLHEKNIPSDGIHGIFVVDGIHEKLLYSGNLVIDLKREQLNATLEKKRIPVISSIGINKDGLQFFNPNADETFALFAVRYTPNVCIMLTLSGGVMNRQGKIIPHIPVSEIDSVINAEYVNGGMKPKLQYAKQIAEYCKGVLITDVPNLLPALFSTEFNGTYIHK